jgi:hypothetical protein
MAKKKKKKIINHDLERINQRIKKGYQELDFFYKIHGSEIRRGAIKKHHHFNNDDVPSKDNSFLGQESSKDVETVD